jgi:flagellar protein FlgJ
LREAARQFESLFTQMMLKSMRDAGRAFRSSDSPTESDQTDFYREMFDNQIASQMSKGKGLGLSDMLVKQLRQTAPPDPSDATAKPIKLNEFALKRLPVSSLPTPTAKAVVDPTTSQAASSSDDGTVKVWCGNVDESSAPIQVDPPTVIERDPRIEAAEPVAEKSTGVSNPPTTPEEFVAQMWPHAKIAAQALGVDPRMLIAHAALETGWGKSIPCNPDGTCSFNLFGIKAGSRWQGPAVGVNTLEFEEGVAVRRRASFRAYDSPADSFRDYASLIKSSPRYAAALGVGNDAAAFANALQQGGYATDPNYASKLTAVAERLRVPFKNDVPRPLASGRRVSAESGGET